MGDVRNESKVGPLILKGPICGEVLGQLRDQTSPRLQPTRKQPYHYDFKYEGN